MAEAFPKIKTINYEGADSRNPLAFKQYNPDEIIEGKSMRDHLRFASCFWHTMRGRGSEIFGMPTAVRPWDDFSETVDMAQKRIEVFFELIEKLQIDFYAFHDRDVSPEGKNLKETNKIFDKVTKMLAKAQKNSGKKLLWGTACLFQHPRFMHGAGTAPNLDAYVYAAAQVKKAIEVTHELGGLGYVFWGGREGYFSLLNTDMKRELDHLGAFMQMAVDYKKKIGFTGPFYIEPKPKEPTKHQYDTDAATTLNFLRQYKLMNDFKLNLETNHAQIAGHTIQHDLEVAIGANALGSVDANMGDWQLGWDTDQFPTDLYISSHVMLCVLKMGGFTTGGLNFDAKVRRESFEPDDLFLGHIAGMDTFARGLKIAAKVRADGRLADFVKQRYSSWDSELGRKIEKGKSSFEELEPLALKMGEVKTNRSGRQEYLESLFNEFI